MNDLMGSARRTDYCGQLGEGDIGRRVTVCGWVSRQRDLGNLIFIDLRDRTGIVQLSFDEHTPKESFERAFSARAEYILMATGQVVARQSINPDLPTGRVEIAVEELRILSRAKTPPFAIESHSDVKEELRLKHRFLDLRRPDLQQAMMARHRIVKLTRDYFDSQGFIEIETPILVRSTPEGARDYLVPSRVHKGSFYALPQSPQQYKQICMIAGFDRYMQIARCFRDEDLRADRQPEFTQIDLEMSFVDQEDVMALNEGYMRYIFKHFLDMELPLPFPRISYKEAMERYGSDKPDTRFGLEIMRLDDLLGQCAFKVFRSVLDSGGSVRALCVKGVADRLSRKEIDKLTDLAKTYKLGGLAFTRLTSEGESSSFEKFLTPEEVAAIRTRLGAQTGDVILIAAHTDDQVVSAALGAVRLELGRRFELYDPASFNLLWVTDFPLFEYDDEDGRYYAMHHPFTAPHVEDMALLSTDPGACRAQAYDMVINGVEVGGGSIRISDPTVQQQMFAALGLDEQAARARFGYFLDAFDYGVPPHGGLAYGLDRLVMLLLGRDNIRDVIAFPKVQNASELMTQAPSPVDAKDLEVLGITVTGPAQ
jgi:aspartyl-tRNA synthetase